MDVNITRFNPVLEKSSVQIGFYVKHQESGASRYFEITNPLEGSDEDMVVKAWGLLLPQITAWAKEVEGTKVSILGKTFVAPILFINSIPTPTITQPTVPTETTTTLDSTNQ